MENRGSVGRRIEKQKESASKWPAFGEHADLQLFRVRLRMIVWVIAGMTLVFAGLARLFRGAPPEGVYSVLGAELFSVLLLAAATYRVRSRQALSWIGLALVASVYLGCVGSTISGEDVHTVAVVFCAVSVGTAALLPWGWRAQGISVLLGVLGLLSGQYFLLGRIGGVFTLAEVVALLTTGFGSVYVAGRFEVQRRERSREHEELQRAHAELREANHRLEQRVGERTSELESMIRDLSTVSQSVSHDLRAPLRTMDGFSQVLMEDFGNELSPEARQWLQGVRDASRRFDALIDDVLLLVRVSGGDCKKEDVDLSAIAESAAAECRRASPHRKARFLIEPGLRCNGDPGLLQVALQKLIGNAWKYSSKGDSCRIEFGALPGTNRTVYFVRDDGTGFDPAYAEAIFEPFSRLHARSAFEGTGMGLPTVRRIMERHGGRVWAESHPQQGSTFFFSLPPPGLERTGPPVDQNSS